MNYFIHILTIFFIFIIDECKSTNFKDWKPQNKTIIVDAIRVKIGESNDFVSISSRDTINVYKNEQLITSNKELIQFPVDTMNERLKLKFYNKIFNFKNKNYRGEIELIPSKGKVLIVNILPLEEYLYSVVPSEMPHQWHTEALKAQSICARTYAVRGILKNWGKDFHVVDNTNDQVYHGIDKENPNTTKAVKDTEGIIVLHSNEPVETFFHSNSGGETENPIHVWGKKAGYLTNVSSDYDKDASNYEWKYTIRDEVINQKFKFLNIGEITEIQITEKTTSNRASKIKFISDSSSIELPATEFRNTLGATNIKSLKFNIEKIDIGFSIEGRGSGHGVGLSQWGSYGMAKNNYGYRSILEHYFKNIELGKIED